MTALDERIASPGRITAGAPLSGGPRRRRALRRAPALYLAPAVALLSAFAVYPLIVLVRMSLSDVGPTNIVGVWHLVGLDNFAAVLSDPETWASTGRTLALAAVLLVSNLVLGFVVAAILSVPGRVTAIALGILVFVWALPPLVTGSVWKFILDDTGIVNAVLVSLGLPIVHFVSDPDLALWTVAGVVAWSALPFSALVLRGGLLSVPRDILEAAALDGAGFWRTQSRIVLPVMRPTMGILAILTVITAFKSFDFFFIITKGGPGTSTTTLPMQSYIAAFTTFDMGIGAAVAVLSMVVVLAVAVPYVRGIRHEEAA